MDMGHKGRIGDKRAQLQSVAGNEWAQSQGVPLAYLYADTSDLAEVILAFGLLPEAEQHRLAVELKARVSAAPPAAARGRKRAGRIKA